MTCELPLDELTVQVWLLQHHQTLNIALLNYVVGMELRMNRQQTNRWMIQLLDALANFSGRGHKNILSITCI